VAGNDPKQVSNGSKNQWIGDQQWQQETLSKPASKCSLPTGLTFGTAPTIWALPSSPVVSSAFNEDEEIPYPAEELDNQSGYLRAPVSGWMAAQTA
jgi:hypothetical protein